MTVRHDVASGASEIREVLDDGCTRIDRNGSCFGTVTEIVRQINELDPLSARMEMHGVATYARDGVCDIRMQLRNLITAKEAQHTPTMTPRDRR